MNPTELLIRAHQAICDAIDGLAETEWELPGAVGDYSPKQVIAHLIAYEQMTEGVLNTLLERDTCTMQDLLRKMDELPDSFNDVMVAQYAHLTGPQVMVKLTALHQSNLAALSQVDPEKLRQPDTLDWYRPGYSAEDFLIYVNFGHKREHAAQLVAWREHLGVTS